MLLSFNVEKQIITRTDTEKVVTNSMNYLYAQFTFTDEWVGEKTAVFKGKHGTYNALLDAENKCLVPWEILTEAMFDVSVFCGDLITANAVKIFTIQSGYEIGDESRIPTPEIYTQVINKLNEIEAEIDPEAIQQIVDTYLADKEIVTEDDVETIVSRYISDIHGIPTGGTIGQVLTKKSNSNYDTEWKDASAVIEEKAITEKLREGFGLGTIGSGNGQINKHTSRCVESIYIPIESFTKVSISDSLIINFFLYDENFGFTVGNGWVNDSKVITKADVKSIDTSNNAVYVRFIFANAGGGTCDVNVVWSGITFDVSSLADNLSIDSLYKGAEIQVVSASKISSRFLTTHQYMQSACYMGGKLISFSDNLVLEVLDIDSDFPSITSGTIDNTAGTPHCNTACFGVEKYDVADKYPLVYINAYNSPNLPKGTVYAHRLVESGSSYATELKQTITIGFTDASIWTDGAGDSRPYGNFIIDTDNNYLYAYTLLDTTRVTRFFKFNLPTLADGASITLAQSDILDTFDVPWFGIIQDNAYSDGKVFINVGYNGNVTNRIAVVDLEQKKLFNEVLLSNMINDTHEPEQIAIKDNTLLLGMSEGAIWEINFVK